MKTTLLLAALFSAQVDAPKPAFDAAPRSAVRAQVPAGAIAQPLRVPENSAAGTVVGNPSFPKGTEGGMHTWSIVSGNDGNVFAIDASTGRLTVNSGAVLDFESRTSFNLGIRVHSKASAEDKLRSSFAAQLKKSGADSATVAKVLESDTQSVVAVEVTNVNEPPSLPGQMWRVRTESPTGTIIGKLWASDPDQGEHLVYSTADEITQRFFAVEPDTGEVAVRDPAALQKAIAGMPVGDFRGEFRATDSAGNSDATKFVLILLAPPAPTPSQTAPLETARTEPAPTKTAEPNVSLEQAVKSQAAETQQATETEASAETTAESETANPESEAAAEVTQEETVAPEHAGGSWFWTILNFFAFVGMTGSGVYFYRSAHAQPAAIGRHFSEERKQGELERALAAQSESIEQERNRLANLKASFESRTQEFSSRDEEIETQKAELLEATEQVQFERTLVENEKQRLADFEAELHQQRNSLTARALELDESQSIVGRLAEQQESLDAREQEIAAQGRRLEAQRAELAESTRLIEAERESIDAEKSRLAELETQYRKQQSELSAQAVQADDSRSTALELENNRLAELKASLDDQALQLAGESRKLEAERAELLESTQLVQAERERIDTERNRLAELEARLQEQQSELSVQSLKADDARSDALELERTRLAELEASLNLRAEQIVGESRELETQRAELVQSTQSLEAQRAWIDAEKDRLAELEGRLQEQQSVLPTESEESADARGEELELERNQLIEMKESLEARARQIELEAEQLEAQRAELLESSEQFSLDREWIDAEKRRLADIEAELHQQREELTVRTFELAEAQSAPSRAAIESVEAAESLVNLASNNLEAVEEETPESAEVLELRHRLADMFGVPDTELNRHRPVHETAYGNPRETEYEGIVKADDRDLSASSSIEAATSVAEPEAIAIREVIPEPAAKPEEGESIDSYMRDLLERQRVRQLYGSTAGVETSRVATSTTVVRPVETAAAAPAPVETEPAFEKPISTSPIHPQDKDAVRNDLASLRSVANQAARSAVLAHTKKKLRNHSLIKVSCAGASFVIAGIVLSTSVATTTVLGWAAAGIGGIMLIDLAHWTYVTRKPGSGRKSE